MLAFGLAASLPLAAETGQVGQGVRGLSGEQSGGGQAYPGGPDAPKPNGATTFGKPPGSAENHVEEALKHARAAAQKGGKGDAAEALEHASTAQTHVQAASREKPDDAQLQTASRHLDDAIRQGRSGHAEAAGKAAEEAAGQLQTGP